MVQVLVAHSEIDADRTANHPKAHNPEMLAAKVLGQDAGGISQTESSMSKFAYKIAMVQCGYVPVVNGEWMGRESEDVLRGITPEQIEEILEAAGCPNELQFLSGLGEDGWELIGVVPQSIPGIHRMYLKKVIA